MKRIYNVLLATLITVSIFAQVPQLLSYQAVIRNSSDQLVANKQVGMKISILQTSISGIAVYTETQTPTTNQNGLISIQIGGGTGFSSINWSNGPYFIKTETDLAGGANYTITGTNQLLSVPYALAAGSLVLTNKNTTTYNSSKSYDNYMKDDGTYMGLVRISVQQPFDSVPTVTDFDGNVYGTVKIGTQVWLTSNLKTTHYRNGDIIPNVTSNSDWGALTSGAQCTYNNTIVADSINLFGRLYNFYAVADSRKIAPIGWHVATDAEWTTLMTYLGGLAGGRLKETGTTHWISPNGDALNDSKFTALPGGYRYNVNPFSQTGDYTTWWSSTVFQTNAWAINLNSCCSGFGRSYHEKMAGFSVRCMRD